MNAEEMRGESRKDPDTLVREIEETRADVGETLDALQARLSPGQLLDQALGFVREHGGELARNLGDSVKQNPMSVLLAGAGIAWMMASQGAAGASRGMRRGYSSYDESHESYGEGLSGDPERLSGETFGANIPPDDVQEQGLGERVGERVDRVKARMAAARERMSGTAGAVSDRLGSGREHARLQAQRAREGFSRMMEEQPLVLGAMGVALGALIGALLPASETEDRMLGSRSDELKQRARTMGEEQFDKARGAVSEAASEKKSEEEIRQGSGVASGMSSQPSSPTPSSR
jgi:ElaB/YqjD/DUF883 family membrane-anchored ribosome-binding protein